MLSILFLNGDFMKNILTGAIFGIILAMWAVYFCQQGKLSLFKKPVISVKPIPTSSVPIFPSITLSPSQTVLNEKTDTEIIRQLFADKYQRKISDVVLTAKEYDGSHFLGAASFKLAMEGGILLAARNSLQQWVIVQDGNGSVLCDNVKPYKFPASMVSECVDKKGKLVKL